MLEELKSISKEIEESIEKARKICVFSHLDADGICSAALLSRFLYLKEKEFKVKFLRQLERDKIKGIQGEICDLLIFLDFGSGQLHHDEFKKIIEERKTIIIDHHQLKENFENENLIHVNPHLFNLDGNSISAAGLVYLICKNLNPKFTKYSYLALVGAYGDRQEKKNEFLGLNRYILEDALKAKVIEIKHGLRIFGRLSKPIHKALEQCTSIFIPHVTGNESGAVQLLSEIGIRLKDENGRWRKLADLSPQEEIKLVTAIILQRLSSLKRPEDVIGNIYEIKGKEDMLGDVNEFSMLLNACGKVGKPDIALSLCLGNSKLLDTSKRIMSEYRKMILNALEFVYENLNNPEVYIQEGKFTAIIGRDKIPHQVSSTVASIIINSKSFPTKKILIVFSDMEDSVKISLRRKLGFKVNLGKIAHEIAEELEGEGGGHVRAAGAKIPKGKELEFVRKFREKLQSLPSKEFIS